MFAKA
jgi:hypothetical protein